MCKKKMYFMFENFIIIMGWDVLRSRIIGSIREFYISGNVREFIKKQVKINQEILSFSLKKLNKN